MEDFESTDKIKINDVVDSEKKDSAPLDVIADSDEKTLEEKTSDENPVEEKSETEKPCETQTAGSEEKSLEEKTSGENPVEEKSETEKTGETQTADSEEKSLEEKTSDENPVEEKSETEKSGETQTADSDEKTLEEKTSGENPVEEKSETEKNGIDEIVVEENSTIPDEVPISEAIVIGQAETGREIVSGQESEIESADDGKLKISRKYDLSSRTAIKEAAKIMQEERENKIVRDKPYKKLPFIFKRAYTERSLKTRILKKYISRKIEVKLKACSAQAIIMTGQSAIPFQKILYFQKRKSKNTSIWQRK